MGKTKNKKRKNRVPCPTGLDSMNELEHNELEDLEDSDNLSLCQNTRTTAVLTAIEKLQSVRVEDKECAACTISLLAEQKDSLADLLSHEIVKVAAPLLMDKSTIVKHSVAGALRNMSAYGGHAACQIMIEQDVLTPLVALLKENYQQNWIPVKSNDDKIDSLTEIFIEAVNLLWNLCESSPLAVSIFNRENLLSILINSFKLEVYKFDVVVAVAHCLHAVTEDNKDVLDLFNAQPNLLEPVTVLLHLTGDRPMEHLLRTLACGISLNLQTCCSLDFRAIVEVLNKTLAFNIQPILDEVFERINELKNKKRRSKESTAENDVKSFQKLISEISDLLLAKQLSLEMITNICCSDDTGDNWEELSGSDISDDMTNMQVESDEETSENVVESSKCEAHPLSIPCEIHEIISSLQIVDKVGQHIFIADDLSSKLDYKPSGHKLLQKILTVQSRALLCLNNLASGLDVEDFGGTQKLYNIWLQIAQMIFKQSADEILDERFKKEFLEAGTSALRAIVQKLAESNAWYHFQSTSPKDLEMLFEVERAACNPPLADPSIRVNVIRVVSALGTLFANSNPGGEPASVEIRQLIKSISLFLLEVSSKDPEVWVSCEALDALMDVFAEDPMNVLAKEINLTEKLQLLLPNLKGKINQQKRSLGIHYPVVMTVKENLIRFIKYKINFELKNARHQESLPR